MPTIDLNDRQWRAIAMYRRGATNQAIGSALGISKDRIGLFLDRALLVADASCGATEDEVIDGEGCRHCVTCLAARRRYAREIARRRASRAVMVLRETQAK